MKKNIKFAEPTHFCVGFLRMKNKYFFLFAFLLSLIGYTQTGKISGKLTDGTFLDPVPFANIQLKGTSEGTSTDFDGIYSFELAPGTYSLIFSYVGYDTVEISEVEVLAGKTTQIDVVLNEVAQGLEEVVITSTAKKNTEVAVLALQRRSANLLDGLSSQTIRSVGSSDIASAIKIVPGVSVQGGKFVYIRGLGDRYTKSILNGIDIPGLDPDRNTLQMDIFPTSILENLIVVKSSAAEYSADFTGGIVNIVTKEFPNDKIFNISVSTSINPEMHHRNDFLGYEKEYSDILGFDFGERNIPLEDPYKTYQPIELIRTPILTDNTRKFNPNMGPIPSQNFQDFSFDLNLGNQLAVGENTLGYYFSTTYKNETSFYENAEDNLFFKNTDPTIFELYNGRSQNGLEAVSNIIFSQLAGVSLKTMNSKYKINALNIFNGQNTGTDLIQEDNSSNFETFKKFNLEYNQKRITNLQLTGFHAFADSNSKLEWALSPSFSRVFDKDVRNTQFVVRDNEYAVFVNLLPTRIWRNLEEENYVAKIDFTKTFKLNDNDSKFKAGLYGLIKNRDFSIFKYNIQVGANQGGDGNPNSLLNDDNIFTQENLNGNYIRFNSNEAIEKGTAYRSEIQNFAGYASTELNFSEKFVATLGIRLEQYALFYTGENSGGTINLENEKVLDKFDYFPSVNLVYNMRENQKLRTSYSKTTARPSFKEASVAQIYDPLTAFTFIGNINIQPSYIDNFDIRFEKYGQNSDFFALSGFYKFFKDPIELATFEGSRNNFQPRNLGNGNVYGVELEFRKSLDFINPNFKFRLNTSLIESRQEIGQVELNLREFYKRTGETISKTRNLQGQSPYLINSGLEYNNEEAGIQISLFYNVQGKTLQVVGLGDTSDIYTDPFNDLNFNFRKVVGKGKNKTINFKISNILGDTNESYFETYNATNQIFSLRDPGTSFSLGYSIKL